MSALKNAVDSLAGAPCWYCGVTVLSILAFLGYTNPHDV
jgi:hypothetical protein